MIVAAKGRCYHQMTLISSALYLCATGAIDTLWSESEGTGDFTWANALLGTEKKQSALLLHADGYHLA